VYDRILMPTDGSACARRAREEGLELAKRLGATVTFLHVVENPLVAGYAAPEALPYSAQLYQDLKKAANDILEEALARAEAAGVDAQTSLVEDRRPTDAIRDAEAGHDLVIMGTHGRRGLDRFMFGSVTEGALRGATKPYLIIRAQDDAEARNG
jgi:nucleotide-binding universal stress UspA family protein